MLIVPIFVPHAGCPHDCCFCDQKKISGHKAPPTEDEIIKTIDEYNFGYPYVNGVKIYARILIRKKQ